MAARRNHAQYSGIRRGQTIVAEREKVISDSERQELRRKAKNKKIYSMLLIIAVVLIVVMLAVILVKEFLSDFELNGEEEAEIFAPTVEIVDEGGTGYEGSARVQEYVGMLEKDVADEGLKVVRAVIPSGKTREVDVYLDGRAEFYKTNLDRGTGVTAEDIARMAKYLTEHELTPAYVDVRVTGKAYYR